MISTLKLYSSVRDSGLPWIGSMPAHWGIERAKRLFTKMSRPVRDGDDVVTCFRDGTVTLRRNRRVRGFTESLKEIGYQGIRRGDLVIHAMDAFAGAIGVSDSDGKGTPVYVVCVARADANPHFYAHIIREMSRSGWITALARGIRERSTDFRYETFADQFVPTPPIEEQAAIVRFIGQIDRRIQKYIAAKRRLIALLNEQKGAIIHHAITRGLDPNVRLKPSGFDLLGDIPMSWTATRLKSLVTEAVAGPYGSSLTKSMYTRSGYRVYGQQQVIQDDFTIGDYYISADKFREMDRYRTYPGDVLVSVMGTIGRVAVVPPGAEAGIINPRLVRYRPNESKIRARFLQLALQSPILLAQLQEAAKGTTMDGLNMQILGKLVLPLPPLTEQDKILKQWQTEKVAFARAQASISKELLVMHELRSRLVSDVVTGKLDVRGATATDAGGADSWADELADELDVEDDADERVDEIEEAVA